MNKIIIFISLLIIISCSYDYDYRVFKTYLNEQFNIDIIQKKHLFIIISEYKCKGCVGTTLLEISKLCNNKDISNITFLSKEKKIIPENLYKEANIIIDSLNQFDNLDIGIANVTLIITEKGRIQLIRPIFLDEIELVTPKYIIPFLSY